MGNRERRRKLLAVFFSAIFVAAAGAPGRMKAAENDVGIIVDKIEEVGGHDSLHHDSLHHKEEPVIITEPGSVTIQPESGTAPGSVPQPGSGTASGNVTQPGSGTAPGSVPQPGSGTVPGNVGLPGSETQPETGDQTEIGIQPESEIQTEAGIQLESEIQTETGTGSFSEENKEELRKLLEQAQREQETHSAISQYLDLDSLRNTADRKGLTVELRAGFGDDMITELGIPDMLRDTSYFWLRLQNDPVRRQWLFDGNLTFLGADLCSFGLYGDRNMLTLFVPQLYEKALGIHGGSIVGQLEGSWAEEVIGQIPEEFRDLELCFYPGEQELKEWNEKFEEIYNSGDVTEQYNELLEDFSDRQICTKEENDGEVVYFLTMDMDAVRELYLGWFDIWHESMRAMNTVTEEEAEQLREQMEEQIDQVESIMPEDLTAEYHVQDGKLSRIRCEVLADLSGQSEASVGDAMRMTEAWEADGGDQLVVSDKNTEETGYIEFDMAFWEGTDGQRSTDISIRIKDENRDVQRAVMFTGMRTENGTQTGNDLDITLQEADADGNLETVYYCNLFSGVFDSQTGEYDITMSLTDQKTGDITYAKIDSKFEDVIPGQGFVWDIGSVTIGYEDERIDFLKGQVRVQARPEGITQPEDPVMLFDVTEDQLAAVIDTISENLNNYGASLTGSSAQY